MRKEVLTPKHSAPHFMQARRIGIDTQHEAVVLMRRDCHVCRSQGFIAHARVRLSHEDNVVIQRR
jgi:thymidine phosphorylase